MTGSMSRYLRGFVGFLLIITKQGKDAVRVTEEDQEDDQEEQEEESNDEEEEEEIASQTVKKCHRCKHCHNYKNPSGESQSGKAKSQRAKHKCVKKDKCKSLASCPTNWEKEHKEEAAAKRKKAAPPSAKKQTKQGNYVIE